MTLLQRKKRRVKFFSYINLLVLLHNPSVNAPLLILHCIRISQNIISIILQSEEEEAAEREEIGNFTISFALHLFHNIRA
jgi:hypothetical protein